MRRFTCLYSVRLLLKKARGNVARTPVGFLCSRCPRPPAGSCLRLYFWIPQPSNSCVSVRRSWKRFAPCGSRARMLRGPLFRQDSFLFYPPVCTIASYPWPSSSAVQRSFRKSISDSPMPRFLLFLARVINLKFSFTLLNCWYLHIIFKVSHDGNYRRPVTKALPPPGDSSEDDPMVLDADVPASPRAFRPFRRSGGSGWSIKIDGTFWWLFPQETLIWGDSLCIERVLYCIVYAAFRKWFALLSQRLNIHSVAKKISKDRVPTPLGWSDVIFLRPMDIFRSVDWCRISLCGVLKMCPSKVK